MFDKTKAKAADAIVTHVTEPIKNIAAIAVCALALAAMALLIAVLR